MQQVPNPECNTASSTVASNHEPRWNRVPRVQPLRNQNDQRVPLYSDQTVPVLPLEENVRGPSTPRITPENAGSSSRRPEFLRHHSHGVQKGARKWADINGTEWFRSLRDTLRESGLESHAFNVSEILQNCWTTESSKWSGIDQDLFTCTAFISKEFLVPTAADSSVHKKSKISSSPFV